MCKCTPTIRTPFCGRGDCQWPEQKPEGARIAQVDRISNLIGEWDAKVPASEDATALLTVLVEMRERIVNLEAEVAFLKRPATSIGFVVYGGD